MVHVEMGPKLDTFHDFTIRLDSFLYLKMAKS